MITMKAYTDIEQSKKLAEFLPLKSADMSYWEKLDGFVCVLKEFESYCSGGGFSRIPCWSLASLLATLPNYYIVNNGIDGIVIWSMDIGSNKYDNLIDACYEMIIKLHEQNLL